MRLREKSNNIDIEQTIYDQNNIIKEAFSNVKVATQNSIGLKFYVVAAPKYCIQVTAENFKDAEKTLHNVAEQIITNIKSLGGEGSFRREK